MTKIQTSFEKTLEEHRELRRMAEGLREYLEAPRPGVGTEEAHGWASGLSAKLVTFHDRVYRHFHEEESGLFDDMIAADPRSARAAKTLRAEHEEILASLRTLLDSTLVYGEQRAPDDPKLRRLTRELLERFDRHEIEENDLIQRLTLEDLGTGD